MPFNTGFTTSSLEGLKMVNGWGGGKLAGNEGEWREAFAPHLLMAYYSTLCIRLRGYLSTNDNDILDILIASPQNEGWSAISCFCHGKWKLLLPLRVSFRGTRTVGGYKEE